VLWANFSPFWPRAQSGRRARVFVVAPRLPFTFEKPRSLRTATSADCYHNQILACLLRALIKANTAFLLLIQRQSKIYSSTRPRSGWRESRGKNSPQPYGSFGEMFFTTVGFIRGYFCASERADEKSLRNVSLPFGTYI
jgi:hypothetical protein